MKKTLILILTVFLLIGVMAVTVSAAPTRTAYCEHCKQDVEWTPWTSATHKNKWYIDAGHYYLYEDIISGDVQKILRGEVCLDLNGKTLSATSRAICVSGNEAADAGLNLMDSAGGGYVISRGGTNNAGGGTIVVSYGSVFNMYSGTLQYITTETSMTTLGGVVSVNGEKNGAKATFNLYGGTIDASQCRLVVDEKKYINDEIDGCGAAVAVYGSGVLNLAGGRVIAGATDVESGRGNCIYIRSKNEKVSVSNNAQIDEIYFDGAPTDSLTVSGKYTGIVIVAGKDLKPSEGLAIANTLENTDISGGTVSCGVGWFGVIEKGIIVLTQIDPNAGASVFDGETYVNYVTFAQALAESQGKMIRLNRNVSDAVVLKQNTIIDLNGYTMTAVTVAEGKTLYCLDSQTDDFTVSDGNYGKLMSVTGTVCGLPLNNAFSKDAYMMIAENGEFSFHRIGLQLTAMTLRASAAGVYYKSQFGGDEMVQVRVAAYGVALSVVDEPTTANLESACKYSRFTNFSAGGLDVDATSTLLTGVLKSDNPYLINTRNANMPIFGSAYLLLKDGTYLFGEAASLSFRQQVEAVSNMFDSLSKTQKDGVYEMYKSYRDIMGNWNIDKIKAYRDPSADNVLKILNISNSHGQDSVWLLPSVLKAEMPDQEIMVVEMYQSYALTEHIQAVQNNSPVYWYQVNTGGFWTTVTQEMTIAEGLQKENWDIIMFNESSRHLGLESKMSQGMIDWFRNHILEQLDYEPKMLYNMTWASPTDERFYTDTTRQPPTATFKQVYTQDYGFDHVNHYNQLVALTKKYLVCHEGFYKIIYNATPIQYAGEVLGVPQYDVAQIYDLYRDYTHLSDYARLIVAYNWYCQMFEVEELTQVKVDMIDYRLRAPWERRQAELGNLNLTEKHKNVIIESVNNSLKNPLSIPTE